MLRPVDSVDGMTAQSVAMEETLRARICSELLALDGIAGVFYDLTHKPPAHHRVGIEFYFAGGSFTCRPESWFNLSVSARSTRESDAWLCVLPEVK